MDENDKLLRRLDLHLEKHRIAPRDSKHNPYQTQVDALKEMLKYLPGNVPIHILFWANRAVYSTDGFVYRALSSDDMKFFMTFILDIGKKQNRETYDTITPERIDEARQRLERLSHARESFINY